MLQEVCAQYWAGPADRKGRTFAEFTVCTLAEENVAGYSYQTRRIVVTDSRVRREGGRGGGEGEGSRGK